MNRPENIKEYSDIDLKLGIKSSLPNVKKTLGLIILLWKCSNKPAELIYSEEDNNQIKINSDLINLIKKHLITYFPRNTIDFEQLINIINENNIFKSQLESLIVAFELIWKIAKISFLDENLPTSKERTGGVRYPKKLNFTLYADIVDCTIESNYVEYLKVLLVWIGYNKIEINKKFDLILTNLFLNLSQDAIFKMQDKGNAIIFNQNSIYSKLLQTNEAVDINGDKEAKGSLRILKSMLSEGMNPYLNYSSNGVVTINKSNIKALKNYQNRVDTYLELSPKKNVIMNEEDKVNTKIKDLSIIYNTNISTQYSNNRILFGAPGTGKSYTLNKDTKDIFKDTDGSYERVTFHPNYSYGSFVGTYKPVSEGNNIRYDYIPGPFMRILIKALKNCIDCKEGNAESQPYILLVEEINRANVAAVFGEVFQLLDRDADGVSEYSINPSEDIKKYLSDKLKIDKDSIEELRIPNNMFIWATMNSADQGVFPMDTAFKRRWDFEYIGVNDEESMVENYIIPMGNSSQRYYVKWNELRKAINKRMQKVNTRINEDKLLGPFFISKSNLDKALDDEEKFIKLFKSKVIMYLFEDAMKMRPQEFFKGHKGDMLYSEICNNFDKLGEKIFEILDLAHFDKNGNEIAKGE